MTRCIIYIQLDMPHQYCPDKFFSMMGLFIALLGSRLVGEFTFTGVISNIWKGMWFVPKSIFGFIIKVLNMPFEMYQTKVIHQTIYIDPSQSKNIRGRKKKGIINKTGIDDIQINPPSDSNSYIPAHFTGSRQSVQKAILLIQEGVGKENFSWRKKKSVLSPAAAADNSTNSEPQPNHEDNVPEDKGSAQPTVDNVSSDTPEDQEQQSTTVQDDIIVTEDDAADGQSSTPLTTEPVEDEAVPSTLEQPQPKKEPIKDDDNQLPHKGVPSEIGINSTQGMTARETITESSVSSVNDGSKVSKTLSTFDMNENDPLLIFLRSQHKCIRGSVDEFYSWLVKSEFIDSMTALKEAVCDDDYYNDTMKVGSGSSGIKVFKRKVFKRALSEYEGNGNKSPTITNLNDPPEELVCPISLVLMTNDPVLAADGITYERASIEDWFKKSKAKGSSIYSPVHGTEMESLILIPNIGIRNMARAFKERS